MSLTTYVFLYFLPSAAAVNEFGLCWSANVVEFPSGPVLACGAIAGTPSSQAPVHASPLHLVRPDDIQLSPMPRTSSLLAHRGKLYFLCRPTNLAGPYYACSYDVTSGVVARHDCAPPAAHFSNFAPAWPVDGPPLVVYPVLQATSGGSEEDAPPTLYALQA